jgi:hypothetical protein
MHSWTSELRAKEALGMQELRKQTEEGNKQKAVKDTQEMLAEHNLLLHKHQQKVAIRKQQAEASLAYWKAQDEISAIKKQQALDILAELDNPTLTREISRLEKKLKSLGVEVKIPEVEVKIPESRDAVAEKALAPNTPPTPLLAPTLPSPSVSQIPKKVIARIPIRKLPAQPPAQAPVEAPVEQVEELEWTSPYPPVKFTDAQVLQEMMRGFR